MTEKKAREKTVKKQTREDLEVTLGMAVLGPRFDG